ncbi:MAG: pyruvate formate lyase-activating protein [Akkermansia sp.]|nr:pyruvate formate lyase-activating protein [Akkermansia sp.]
MTAASVSGLIHSVESCGTVDGPGIRFIVFLSGCSLRCQYCHNPDTSFKRRGKERTVEDVLEEISRYASFLKTAKGGVTISGGDPLFQPDFTRALLHGCKEMGLHTCVDTSGHLGCNADDAMLADTDLVLLDIKAWNPEQYKHVTGQNLQPTLDFAEKLAARGIPMWLRYVLVPGLTDQLEDITALARYAAGLGNVQRVDVLPFHQMGKFKWGELGLEYPLMELEPPVQELTVKVRSIFRENGFSSCTH